MALKRTTKEIEAIRKAVEIKRAKAPVSKDPLFSAMRDAKIGLPVMVYSPEGKEAFWLVPILMGDSACGFARVELSHNVSQVGIYGSGPEDHASWIDASFFEKPPSGLLDAIRSRYSGMKISEPLLSYDKSPARWAWRIEVEDEVKTVVFITPGGWYEQVAKDDRNREG